MREDMSDFLIHFTKGDTLENAYQNLKSIMRDYVVRGSNTNIKGGYQCVCFSEAPLSSLQNGLLNPTFYSNYSPFGVITTKSNIFSLGGRPAIYQPDSEFDQLIDGNKWRHMRYEPPDVDFTWEREWRLKTEGYEISPETTQMIVPDSTWIERLMGEYEEKQRWQTLQYSQIMDELLALQYEEPFPWVIIPLRNT